MKLHRYIKKTHSLVLGCVALFSAVACGSYEYAGSDQDGIYASEPKVGAEQQPSLSENERTVQEKETKSNDSGYYANYFGQESEKIEKAQEIMFTDVEAYSSNRADSTGVEEDAYAGDGQISYLTGDPSWGSNPSEINVNYYNSGFSNPYYYDYGYGWGYPSYGISFHWGWHSPYGWFYNPYYYNPYYYAYTPYYYNPYYYNPYYYNPYYSYSPYYGRRTAYHPTYRNGYRSNDYDRNAARSQSRNNRTYSRDGVRTTDRNVRSSQNDRNSRSSVDRIRNPRNINAGTRTRTRSSNDRSVRTERNVNSRTRTTAPTRRTRSNNTSTRTRSSSNNNNSGTNVRSRTYSSPSTPTRSTRSNSSSGRRGGR
ncbi:MAG TPA: hypothetical protein VFM82_10460 [Flavobacteriaceae bacterium]|nr:hypothetical protein [Flavobacteriaceae bacterium]